MAGRVDRRFPVADGDGESLQWLKVVGDRVADGSLASRDGEVSLAVELEVAGRLGLDVDADVGDFDVFLFHYVGNEHRLYLHGLLAVLV